MINNWRQKIKFRPILSRWISKLQYLLSYLIKYISLCFRHFRSCFQDIKLQVSGNFLDVQSKSKFLFNQKLHRFIWILRRLVDVNLLRIPPFLLIIHSSKIVKNVTLFDLSFEYRLGLFFWISVFILNFKNWWSKLQASLVIHAKLTSWKYLFILDKRAWHRTFFPVCTGCPGSSIENIGDSKIE